jgi:hypothetical protein
VKSIDDPTILFYCEVDVDKKTIMVNGNPANIESLKDMMIEAGKQAGKPIEIVCGLNKDVEEFTLNLFSQFLLDRTMQSLSGLRDLMQSLDLKCNNPQCVEHGYDPTKVN